LKSNLNGKKNRTPTRPAERQASAGPAEPTAIERLKLARLGARPQSLDYFDLLLRDFLEIHGDRRFGDDGAIVAGLAYFGGRPVAVVGQQRGRTTPERIKRNFGSAKPEGYRKAARVFILAERFGLPLVTFIDTQGADPGVSAEERGQIEAIAANLELMSRLTVPCIACIIGEGESGGALALGVANRVLMQENACYSVITPEGCAAILWRAATEENVARAANVLKIAAPDLLSLGIVDEIVPEPQGGAHTAPAEAAHLLGAAIARNLEQLVKMKPQQLRRDRERKFAAMGSAFVIRTRVENERPIG
jgi:acetyl-CoA carboxylase carboxyl transferase subunit alpha